MKDKQSMRVAGDDSTDKHLPVGWQEKSLSDVASIRVSNVDKKSNPGEIPVRLCNYIDVYNNRYITKHLPFMEATATRDEIARFGVQLGDVMITKDSETPDDIGVPAVAMWTEPNLVCGYHLALFRPDQEQVHPVFLAKQLCTHNVITYYGRLATGSTRYGLSTGGIAKTPLLLPHITHQRKIAKILTTLDNLIEKTESLIAKYQAIKQGMMHDLFTRGVDEHGQLRPPQSEAPQLYQPSPLGPIPRQWWVASIGDLFDKRTEHGRPGLPVMSIVMEHGLVLRSSVDRRVESNLPPEGHALVVKGDIAYNMMRMWQGVLGRADFDCLVSPAYVVMKPKEAIDTEYAAYLFSDRDSIAKFRQMSQGVVDDRLRLYFNDLVNIRFAVPRSLAEQRTIALRLQMLDQRIAVESEVLLKYQRQRFGLMQDLLTGRVPVKLDETEEVANHA